MRTRGFTASDLVQLPRFDAGSAIAAGTSMKTAFKAAARQSDVPTSVQNAANHLFTKHEELRKDFAARTAGTGSSGDLRAADTELDACWAAFYSFLGGYARLPLPKKEQAKNAAARRLLTTIFTDGIKFTQLAYKLEWAESQARLDLLDNQESVDDIALLGAELFVTTLAASHKRYGDLQGLTKAAPTAPSPDLRGKLNAFGDALRTYVVKVSALAEENDGDSVDLVDTLLGPLQSWRDLGGSQSAAEPAMPPPVAPPQTPPAAPPGAGDEPPTPGIGAPSASVAESGKR